MMIEPVTYDETHIRKTLKKSRIDNTSVDILFNIFNIHDSSIFKYMSRGDLNHKRSHSNLTLKESNRIEKSLCRNYYFGSNCGSSLYRYLKFLEFLCLHKWVTMDRLFKRSFSRPSKVPDEIRDEVAILLSKLLTPKEQLIIRCIYGLGIDKPIQTNEKIGKYIGNAKTWPCQSRNHSMGILRRTAVLTRHTTKDFDTLKFWLHTLII